MKYKGSCHCGNVNYEVDMTLDGAMACNCSMCGRKGTLLAFTPETNFKLLSGKESLKDYQFGKKSIHHYFCSNCGVTSFASGQMPDGTKISAINVRCLEGVDIENISIQHVNGKAF